MNLSGTILDPLFERWLATYSPDQRAWFHRDGAVDEEIYWRERHRLVFLLTEANSKGGKYERYKGWDLRVVLGQEELSKEFNINMGLWVHCLLDGATKFYRPDPAAAQHHIRRAAAINLKKLGGQGTAGVDELTQAAIRDRAFILEEIETLQPTCIITCGPKVNRVFGRVSTGNQGFRAPDDDVWRHDGIPVLPGNSPSIRPYQRESCFNRLLTRARSNLIAAFSDPEVTE